MTSSIQKDSLLKIEGSYDSSTKELVVADSKLQHVSKGFFGWLGWFFGQNVFVKITSGKNVLTLYVPKEIALSQAKTGKIFAETLYKKAHAKDIEITTVSPKKEPYHIPNKKLTAIQAELDKQQIPLTCRTFAPLKESNHLCQDQIDKYLQPLSPEHKAIKQKFFESIQKISYEDLEKDLFACTQELNNKLNNQDFALGYAENKSQKWIAELALQYLNKPPVDSFSTYTAFSLSGAGSEQSSLSEKANNLVVFDDAAYSGTQMCELLENLVTEISKKPNQPKNIYFVIPFMSDHSKTKLQETWDKLLLTKSPDTKLYIITSSTKVTSFAEKYPPNSQERKDLFACEEALCNEREELYRPQEENSYIGHGGKDEKCLTYMEWKMPDCVSVPRNMLMGGPDIKNQIKFCTNFLPPYKAKE